MSIPRGLLKRSLLPSLEACEAAGKTADDRRKLRNLLKARRKSRLSPRPDRSGMTDAEVSNVIRAIQADVAMVQPLMSDSYIFRPVPPQANDARE